MSFTLLPRDDPSSASFEYCCFINPEEYSKDPFKAIYLKEYTQDYVEYYQALHFKGINVIMIRIRCVFSPSNASISRSCSSRGGIHQSIIGGRRDGPNHLTVNIITEYGTIAIHINIEHDGKCAFFLDRVLNSFALDSSCRSGRRRVPQCCDWLYLRIEPLIPRYIAWNVVHTLS